MSEELSQEQVFADDKDPLEAIAELRREEGSEISEELEAGISESQSDTEESSSATEEDEIDALQEKPEVPEKELGTKDTEGDTSTNEDIPENGKEEKDESDKNTYNKDEEVPDSEGKEEKPTDNDVVKTFKANGQEFSFTQKEINEQFETTFGKSMNFTQKMQKIAPYRKMISALEEEGITQDQLNVALDAIKGDKGAIQQILKTNKIDAFDLDSTNGEEPEYTPTSYGKEESQLAIEEVTGRIANDDEYVITVDVVDNQWDPESRQTLSSNPNLIEGLHNDIKSGVYDSVAPIAMKMKVLDGNTKSDLQYYILAGEQFTSARDSVKSEKTVADLNKNTQVAENKFEQASSEATKKRAATSTGSRAGSKGVIDYLDDDNDEKYDAWYKNLQANN